MSTAIYTLSMKPVSPDLCLRSDMAAIDPPVVYLGPNRSKNGQVAKTHHCKNAPPKTHPSTFAPIGKRTGAKTHHQKTHPSTIAPIAKRTHKKRTYCKTHLPDFALKKLIPLNSFVWLYNPVISSDIVSSCNPKGCEFKPLWSHFKKKCFQLLKWQMPM